MYQLSYCRILEQRIQAELCISYIFKSNDEVCDDTRQTERNMHNQIEPKVSNGKTNHDLYGQIERQNEDLALAEPPLLHYRKYIRFGKYKFLF